VRPIDLAPNQIRRFYRGGARIAAFRGEGRRADDAPEDWVGSTTTVRGDGALGLTRLRDGRLLRDALDAHPEAYLGPEHLRAFGADPLLLVKLLDAGERLPLHLHPDDRFAQEHLGERHGKTEAWIVLDAGPGSTVHLGFARDVRDEELDDLFVRQDVDAMVAAMNRLPARAGDTFFVPAGLPHVIGEGIFLLELQQPSDLSLLLERGGATEADACLGLPRSVALGAVDRRGWTSAEVGRLSSNRGTTLFTNAADPFFRARRIGGGSLLEPSFSIVVVLAGEGALETPAGYRLTLRAGSTALVPFAAGEVAVRGDLSAIRCLPPASPSAR
jgi:mannose-6-phosphate isomerase